MPGLISFKDTPLQKEFVFSPHKLTGYFGKIRAGKTIGGCSRALLLAELYPGNEILIGRQSYKQLFDTTWRDLIGLVRQRNGGNTKPGLYVERYIESNSGPDANTLFIKTKGEPSRIRARYVDDIDSFLSGEWGAFFLDQIEGIDEEVYNQVENRLTYWNVIRSQRFLEKHGYLPKSFGYVTGNPDPGWVYDRFKINAKQKYFFIETTLKENAANLQPGYFDDLARDNPPSWVDRYLNNDWSIKAGQIYKEFDERVHGIQSFPIPDHWSRWIGMDWGYGHPTAVYWLAADEVGNVYFYRELFKAGWIASQIAQAIREMSQFTAADGTHQWEPVQRLEGTWLMPDGKSSDHVLVYMPRDMNKHDGIVNRTVKEEFALYGVQGMDANQSVEAGILKFQERLHAKSVFIFKDQCPALIKGMKTYIRDEVTGKPVKKDDDAADGARYTLMAALENKSEFAASPKQAQDEYQRYAIGQALEALQGPAGEDENWN